MIIGADVGELGGEISMASDMDLKLWDSLWEAGREHGVIAAGQSAFTSMRLESGYGQELRAYPAGIVDRARIGYEAMMNRSHS